MVYQKLRGVSQVRQGLANAIRALSSILALNLENLNSGVSVACNTSSNLLK
jgi:hypothetical protein